MSTYLLDTHCWAWSLTDDPRLSETARSLLETAERVFVSPISLFEIGQKVRIGKWPGMEPWLADLPDLLERQGGHAAPLGPTTCLLAATLEWAHRDPFDRMIAATAIEMGIPVLSADLVFDEVPAVQRIW